MKVIIGDHEKEYANNLAEKLKSACPEVQFFLCADRQDLEGMTEKDADLLLISKGFIQEGPLSAVPHIFLSGPGDADKLSRGVSEGNPYYAEWLGRFTPPERLAACIRRLEKHKQGNDGDFSGYRVLYLTGSSLPQSLHSLWEDEMQRGVKTLVIPLLPAYLLPEWLRSGKKEESGQETNNLSSLLEAATWNKLPPLAGAWLEKDWLLQLRPVRYGSDLGTLNGPASEKLRVGIVKACTSSPTALAPWVLCGGYPPSHFRDFLDHASEVYYVGLSSEEAEQDLLRELTKALEHTQLLPLRLAGEEVSM